MSGKQKECGYSWTSEGEIHTCSLPEGHTAAHICGFVFNPSDCCLERAAPTPHEGEAVPKQAFCAGCGGLLPVGHAEIYQPSTGKRYHARCEHLAAPVVSTAAPEPPTRNSEVLKSFVDYCREKPELRFWQALRNWSGYRFILAADCSPATFTDDNRRDTFDWEGKRHDEKKPAPVAPEPECPICGKVECMTGLPDTTPAPEPHIVVRDGHKRECASNLRIAMTQGMNVGVGPAPWQNGKPVYIPIPACNCGAEPAVAPESYKPAPKEVSPVVAYTNRFGVMAPMCTFGCTESQYDLRCVIHRPAATPVTVEAPETRLELQPVRNAAGSFYREVAATPTPEVAPKKVQES